MRHGFPYEIVWDNAPNLMSATGTNHCKQYVINHHKAISYWPKRNTEIEQFSRALEKAIKSINVGDRDWRRNTWLHISIQYNTTLYFQQNTSKITSHLRTEREKHQHFKTANLNFYLQNKEIMKERPNWRYILINSLY